MAFELNFAIRRSRPVDLSIRGWPTATSAVSDMECLSPHELMDANRREYWINLPIAEAIAVRIDTSEFICGQGRQHDRIA